MVIYRKNGVWHMGRTGRWSRVEGDSFPILFFPKVWLTLEEKRVPYTVKKVDMSCYGEIPPPPPHTHTHTHPHPLPYW